MIYIYSYLHIQRGITVHETEVTMPIRISNIRVTQTSKTQEQLKVGAAVTSTDGNTLVDLVEYIPAVLVEYNPEDDLVI